VKKRKQEQKKYKLSPLVSYKRDALKARMMIQEDRLDKKKVTKSRSA